MLFCSIPDSSGRTITECVPSVARSGNVWAFERSVRILSIPICTKLYSSNVHQRTEGDHWERNNPGVEHGRSIM